MRKKLSENEKKSKVSFTINEKVNELLEEEMKKKGKKKILSPVAQLTPYRQCLHHALFLSPVPKDS